MAEEWMRGGIEPVFIASNLVAVAPTDEKVAGVRSLRLVRVECDAHIVEFARRLIKPRRQYVAQVARRIREAVEHLDKQRPRDDQHGRGLERRRGGGAHRLGEQRDLAQKRARPDRDVAAVVRRRMEADLLDDETAGGFLAGTGQ